ARMIAGPFADQGLLIARDHYERLGGHAPNAPNAEARLLRQLGRSSLTLLHSRIVTV
ncbi:MAG: glycosyl transferase, partial [Bradyrhizobium sp.]